MTIITKTQTYITKSITIHESGNIYFIPLKETDLVCISKGEYISIIDILNS